MHSLHSSINYDTFTVLARNLYQRTHVYTNVTHIVSLLSHVKRSTVHFVSYVLSNIDEYVQ